MTARRLLLMLAVLALLAASGVVWAAATFTTATVLQIPVGLVDPGTTWTADGMTHVRGMVVETQCHFDWDGDGSFDDQVSFVEFALNSVQDADGAGPRWGTWFEYDPADGTVLGGGRWQGETTCWDYLAAPGDVVGSGHVWGWVYMPNGEWAQCQYSPVTYAVSGEPYSVNIGEARFLVPDGE